MVQSQLGLSVISLPILIPLQWLQFLAYLLFLSYKIIFCKMRIDGQLKIAIYAYNIPMLARAVTSTTLYVTNNSENSSYYMLQLVIYKLCLFIAIFVGFMMKKIEILINFDMLSPDSFKKQLGGFVCRSRIYLILFLVDFMFSITLSIWQIKLEKYNDGKMTD